jgi:hypothetical protein
MSTVASRSIRSTPYRDAAETWDLIVSLLVHADTQAKAELQRVAGVAASVIADLVPKNVPIVVTCDGPRTRIYCLYDEDAIEGTDAQEDVLGFNPLRGEWSISLPCEKEDLSWVQAALAKHSKRITARDRSTGIAENASKARDAVTLSVDPKGFLG